MTLPSATSGIASKYAFLDLPLEHGGRDTANGVGHEDQRRLAEPADVVERSTVRAHDDADIRSTLPYELAHLVAGERVPSDTRQALVGCERFDQACDERCSRLVCDRNLQAQLLAPLHR